MTNREMLIARAVFQIARARGLSDLSEADIVRVMPKLTVAIDAHLRRMTKEYRKAVVSII